MLGAPSHFHSLVDSCHTLLRNCPAHPTLSAAHLLLCASLPPVHQPSSLLSILGVDESVVCTIAKSCDDYAWNPTGGNGFNQKYVK